MMDDTLDSSEEQIEITEKDIFIKIWTSPRAVFKYINEHHYDKYVKVLLILSGISRAFDRTSSKNMGDNMSLWAIIATCVVFGGLLGWLTNYIYAALISWTGKWFKGQGDTTSILRVIAYALTPSVIALLLLIPPIGFYGIEMFRTDGHITSAGWIANIFDWGSIVAKAVLGICTVVFCVIGISEVQKLSIGKSILNLFLPALIIVVPIVLLVVILK